MDSPFEDTDLQEIQDLFSSGSNPTLEEAYNKLMSLGIIEGKVFKQLAKDHITPIDCPESQYVSDLGICTDCELVETQSQADPRECVPIECGEEQELLANGTCVCSEERHYRDSATGLCA